MTKPILHAVNKDKGFTLRQDICRISTNFIDKIYGVFKIVLYIVSLFLLFLFISTVTLYCIKLLFSSGIAIKLLPEVSKVLSIENIIDLALKISTAGAGFGIVGTYYTIWNGFWTNYGELRKQLLANPFLYDLWYESESGDYKVWVQNLSKEEKIITLIFLEAWADAYLAIGRWKMLLHGYSINFTTRAKLVAQELNLFERGEYGLNSAIRLGIVPESEIPPIVKMKFSVSKFFSTPQNYVCNKCRQINNQPE